MKVYLILDLRVNWIHAFINLLLLKNTITNHVIGIGMPLE